MYFSSLNGSTGYAVKNGSFIDTLAYATASKGIQHAIKTKNSNIRRSDSVQSNHSRTTKRPKRSRSGKSSLSSNMANSPKSSGHRKHKSRSDGQSKPQPDERYLLLAPEMDETANDYSYKCHYDGHFDDEHLYKDETQPDFCPPRGEYQQRAPPLPQAPLTPAHTPDTNRPPKQRSPTQISFTIRSKQKTHLPATTVSSKPAYLPPHLVPPDLPLEKNKKKPKMKGNVASVVEILMSKLKLRESGADCQVNKEEGEKDDGVRKRGKFSYDPALDPLYAHLPREKGEHFPGEIVINPVSSQEPRVTVFCVEKGRSISPHDAAHATQKQHQRWARTSSWGDAVGPDTASLSREPEQQDRGRRRGQWEGARGASKRSSVFMRWPDVQADMKVVVEDGQEDEDDDGIDMKPVWPDDSLTAVEERKRYRERWDCA